MARSLLSMPSMRKHSSSESMRVAEDQEAVGEGGISGSSVLDVRNAAQAVPLESYRRAQAEEVVAQREEDPGFDADGIAGPAEPVASADEVMDGDSFHATGEAECDPLLRQHRHGRAQTEQVLIGHREDRLGGAPASGQPPICRR